MATTNELDSMAKMLDSHPDYRVLRRMDITDFEVVKPKAKNLRVALLDVETTGLSFDSDKIIELAAVVIEVDHKTKRAIGVIETYQGYEDPGFPIPEVATAINGITDATVAGKRLDDEKLAAMFADVSLVIAHNAGFDRKFVEERLPLFQGMKWACSQTQIDWKAEGIGSAKLEYLAYQYGFFYGAHRALVDSFALVKLLTDLLPISQVTGLEHLLAQAASPVVRIWAINSSFDTKDILKGRGYSWEPVRRCWHLSVRLAEVKAEAKWLRDNVYGGREVLLEFEELDATKQFSVRPGRVLRKTVPALKRAA